MRIIPFKRSTLRHLEIFLYKVIFFEYVHFHYAMRKSVVRNGWYAYVYSVIVTNMDNIRL